MLNRNTKLLSLAVLGGTLSFAGCSTAPMHVIVDPSLATAEVYEVDGLTNYSWNQPIKFGPFLAEKPHAVESSWDWTASGSTFLADVEEGTRTDLRRFVFVGEKGERWQVDCRATTPVQRRRTGDDEETGPIGETRRACILRDPAGSDHSLAFHGSGRDLRGEAQFGDAVIDILALHDIPDRNGRPFSIPGPLGYELRQGEHVIASVDLLGHGRVYLAHELPAELRTPVAMTATVLMVVFKS